MQRSCCCDGCVTSLAVYSLYAYYFVVDRRNGLAVYHPLLPKAAEEDNLPIKISIMLLEYDAFRQGVIGDILRYDDDNIGTRSFTTTGRVAYGRG